MRPWQKILFSITVLSSAQYTILPIGFFDTLNSFAQTTYQTSSDHPRFTATGLFGIYTSGILFNAFRAKKMQGQCFPIFERYSRNLKKDYFRESESFFNKILKKTHDIFVSLFGNNHKMDNDTPTFQEAFDESSQESFTLVQNADGQVTRKMETIEYLPLYRLHKNPCYINPIVLVLLPYIYGIRWFKNEKNYDTDDRKILVFVSNDSNIEQEKKCSDLIKNLYTFIPQPHDNWFEVRKYAETWIKEHEHELKIKDSVPSSPLKTSTVSTKESLEIQNFSQDMERST